MSSHFTEGEIYPDSPVQNNVNQTGCNGIKSWDPRKDKSLFIVYPVFGIILVGIIWTPIAHYQDYTRTILHDSQADNLFKNKNDWTQQIEENPMEPACYCIYGNVDYNNCNKHKEDIFKIGISVSSCDLNSCFEGTIGIKGTIKDKSDSEMHVRTAVCFNNFQTFDYYVSKKRGSVKYTKIYPPFDNDQFKYDKNTCNRFTSESCELAFEYKNSEETLKVEGIAKFEKGSSEFSQSSYSES